MMGEKSPSNGPIEASDINNNKRWATPEISLPHQSKLEYEASEKRNPILKTPRKQHPIPVVELASDICFIDGKCRIRASSTPEISQPRQRSFSQHSIGKIDFSLGLSPRKRSVGLLDPLQQSTSKAGNGKVQSKIGRKPKLRSSKSSPNFQELFNKPNTAVERLVSVEEHEYEGLNIETFNYAQPLRKVKSNFDLHAMPVNYVKGTAVLIDLECTSGSPICSRTNTPRLSSQRNSRSRLLQPILNAPTITIDEDLDKPLFFSTDALSSRSRSATPRLEALRGHVPPPNLDCIEDSLVDELPIRRHSPDPILWRSKQSSLQDGFITTNGVDMQLPEQRPRHSGISEDLEVFDAKPRADVLLNLRYSPENSSTPYVFSSKPKKALLAIEYDLTNNAKSETQESVSVEAVHSPNPQNSETPEKGKHSHNERTKDTKENKAIGVVSIPIQTEDCLQAKENKPFVTLEELDAMPVFAEQMPQSSKVEEHLLVSANNGLKEANQSEKIKSQHKSDLVGIFLTKASSEIPGNLAHYEHTQVNHKPDVCALGKNKLNMSLPLGQQMETGDSQVPVETSVKQTPEFVVGSQPKKGVLSSRAVDATNRLYEAPKRSQLRMPTTTTSKNLKVKTKTKTSATPEGGRALPKPKSKTVSQMGSKPSAVKVKKQNKAASTEKLKSEGKKVERAEQNKKDVNDNISRVKKGQQYEVKTEQLLQRFEEQLSATPMKSGRSSATGSRTGEISNQNTPSTPVIEDAYPKPDEDEEILLQKVKVTVANIHYPRRIKSSLPRKPKQQNAAKKGKDPKTPPSEEKEQPTEPKDFKKLVRATSAGLVIEKGGWVRSSTVSVGEGNIDLQNFDPEKHTIVSGKDWQVIALKNEARPNAKVLNEAALSIIDEVDSIATEPFGSTEESSSGPNWGMLLATTDGNAEEMKDNSNEVIVSQQGDDKNQAVIFVSDLPSPEFDASGTFSLKKSVIVPKAVTQEQDPGTDLEIDVIQLLEEGREDSVTSARLKLKTKQVAELAISGFKKEHSIVMQNEEVVFLDPPDAEHHNQGSPVDSESRRSSGTDHLVQPLQVWNSEEYDPMHPNRDEDQGEETDTDEDTLDVNHNLQQLMKTMRQRSELDAHTLANYKKGQEDYNSDTTSECSINIKQNFVLEEGALSQLFDDPSSPLPTQEDLHNSYDVESADKIFGDSVERGDEGASVNNDEVFMPRRCESRFSETSENMLVAAGDVVDIPFQHYYPTNNNDSVDLDNENDSYHIPDTDEEEMQEMLMRTLHASASDDESTLQGNGPEENVPDEFSDAGTFKSGDVPRLTQEILKKHNQHQQEVLTRQGTMASIFNQYRVTDRNNMQSRTSTATRTTDYSQNTDSTLKAELDTSSCLGWRRGKELGHGSYGTVFEGLTRNGQLIAVKLVELTVADRKTAESEYQRVHAEVEILKTLRHENVVRLLGTCLQGSTVQIFMEHVAGGSIHALLMQYGSLKERIFRNYTRQILTGVQYLHSSSVIHRDIKGSNVMLMTCGIIKLIDFGCAKRLHANYMNRESHDSEDGKLSISICGTPYWMAPEVITAEGHGPKSDIWSIGCTVYEMATTKPPLRDLEPAAAMFRIGDGTEMPRLPRSDFSRSTVKFVKKCLARDPRKRPSAADLLQHKFILRSKPKSAARKSQEIPT